MDAEHPNRIDAETWEEFAEQARSLPTDDRVRHLATLLLSDNAAVTTARNRDHGLPANRPAHALTREVAADLLADDADARARVVALVSLSAGRRFGTGDPIAVDAYERAVGLARSLDDPLLLAWVLACFAMHLTMTRHPEEALPRAEEAVRLADAAPPGYGPFAAVVTAWRDTTDPELARRIVAVMAHRRLAKALGALGRYDEWVTALRTWEEVARPLVHVRPRIYGTVLSEIAGQEQLVYGQADLSRFEEFVPDDDVRPARRGLRAVHLMEQAANAVHRGDLQGAIEHHRHRIRFWAQHHDVDPALDAAAMAEVVRALPEGRRRALNDIANPAHEIGRRLLEIGDEADRVDRHARAAAHLDLAEAVWAGWGVNGLVAVAFRRACMLPSEDQAAVEAMLVTVDTAVRPGLRTSAAFEAARRADASTAPRLEAVLDGMLTEPWSPRERARALAARAWLHRPGGPLPGETAAADGVAALALLPAYPKGALDLVASMGLLLALVGRTTGDAVQEARGARTGLEAVARLYSGATTRDYRARIADEWAPVVRVALDVALRTDDPLLADLAAEVVRRDGAAVLLRDVEEDRTAAPALKEVAGRVIAARGADADRLTSADAGAESSAEAQPADDDDGDGAQRMRARGREISEAVRVEAQQAAERLLGAFAAEFDPATLADSRPSRLLGASSRPTFVLQLLPSTHRAVRGERPLLHRRLTWQEEGAARELLDAVPLPPTLLDRPGSGELLFEREPPVLPAPLVDALREAERTGEPIRLLVVPTGLFHLYWDAIEFGTGAPLIDAAVVSVHTSLTAALRIRDAQPATADHGSIAVLDEVTLDHTWREREALERHFPELLEASGKAELRDAAQRPVSLLALALHGVDDVEGWAQAKRLPTAAGEPEQWLTAAEALSLTFPRICVLASCLSTVTTSGDTDIAGFPTAMFARGAHTIVGSVNVIPDESTSRILAAFYERLHATGNPVEALRDARLSYIAAADPDHERPERWGRLVVYGGAEH